MASDEPTSYEPYLREDAEDLYEHAPCGYLSWLPDGTVVKVNQTFLDWTGYAREDLVGQRRFPDLLTAGGRIYHETHVGPLLRMQQEVREVALEVRRADGSRLPVLLNSVVRRDAAGASTVVRTTVFDATDRRSYERELLLARRRERAALERVERLQRVTARLAAGLPLPAIAAVLVEELTGYADIEELEVALIGLDPGRLVDLTGTGVLEADDAVRAAMADGSPVFATGEAVVPLIAGGAARGVLRARSRGENAFADEDERALLVACAGQGAQALERARLDEEAVEGARRARVLADAGRALDDHIEEPERLDRLLRRLVPDVADIAWIVPLGDGRPRPPVALDEHRAHVAALVGSVADGPGAVPAVVEADGVTWSCAEVALRGSGRLRVARASPGRWFGPEHARFLAELGERAGAALEIARLSARNREVARSLQTSLLAGELPDDPRLPLTTAYRPAVEGLQVGGDWYDAFRLAGDVIAVVVGDVVGRGVEAAGTMGQLRSAIRALAGSGLGPAGLLERLDAFSERVGGAEMATVAYAEIELASGVMRYACAGHPPPVLVTPGIPSALLWGGRSAPLGAYLAASGRTEDEVVLDPGSRVLLYTDGLVERRRRGLDVQLVRLCDEVDVRRDAPLEAFGRGLADAMLADETAADDVCLLALTYGATERFERVLAADLDEVAPLRADLRAWLGGHEIVGDDLHALVLACSEAVANAIEHGYRDKQGTVAVEARITGTHVELRVRDEGEWRGPRPAGDRGRGLLIVDRVMEDVDLDRADGTALTMRRRLQQGTSS